MHTYCNMNNEKSSSAPNEINENKRSNERIMPWMRKHLTDASWAAMAHCGDYLKFLSDEKKEHLKLDIGYFCKQRFCAGCAWRESVRTAQCIGAISVAMAEHNRVMIMVTLTVPNVPGAQLRDKIKHINQSWNRLLKRTRYATWRDHIKAIEVTYNAESDTYHPHIHAIVYVKPSYFRGKLYVSHAQLLSDWREVTGQPEITQVDIRRCRDSPTGSNAVLEVSKYICKASDYAQSETVLDIFYSALHRLNAKTYAGQCKEMRALWLAGRMRQYDADERINYVMQLTYIWQKLSNEYELHAAEPYDAAVALAQRNRLADERLEAVALARELRLSRWDEWLRDYDTWLNASARALREGRL